MIRVGKFSSVLFLLLAVFTGLLPFAVPQICQEALREGLVLCGGPLLLSLFPFLVVSSLLIQCPAGERLAVPFRPVVRLIGLDNHCAARVLMIGFLGGFAPAASAAAEAVRTGQMTAEEADALLPACVCSGPSFVILTVGRYLLGSTELGAAVILVFRVGAAAAELLAGLHRLAGQAGGTAFSCLLRCTGLTLLTDYTRSLCEEAGAESLGWCVGLAVRCLILAAAWPLLEEIGQRIWSIAG